MSRTPSGTAGDGLKVLGYCLVLVGVASLVATFFTLDEMSTLRTVAAFVVAVAPMVLGTALVQRSRQMSDAESPADADQ